MSSIGDNESTIFDTTNDFNLGFNCNKLIRNILLISSIDTKLSIPRSRKSPQRCEWCNRILNNCTNIATWAKVITLLKLSCFGQLTGKGTT